MRSRLPRGGGRLLQGGVALFDLCELLAEFGDLRAELAVHLLGGPGGHGGLLGLGLGPLRLPDLVLKSGHLALPLGELPVEEVNLAVELVEHPHVSGGFVLSVDAVVVPASLEQGGEAFHLRTMSEATEE